jgi:hypothetical protein
MTTEYTPVTTRFTLLEELVGRTRLSWLRMTAAVGLVLFLLLGGAAYLNGVLGRAAYPDDGLFRPGSHLWAKVREVAWQEVDKPIVIVYILLIQPFMRRLRDRAIKALRSLTMMGDESFDRIVAEVSVLDLRREWLALGVGAAAGLLLGAPWAVPRFWPIKLYLWLSTALVYGLAGWIIYVSLTDSRLFNVLLSQPLDIDVFDLTPLEPVARWSLGLALSFSGSIALSALLNPSVEEFLSIEGIITYGGGVLVTVLVFFLGIRRTHRVMVRAKEEKLRLVRHNLATRFQEAQEQEATSEVHAWLAYEKRIQDAPEWPYTTDIMRSLLVSTLLPAAVFIIRMLLLEVFRRLLFLP